MSKAYVCDRCGGFFDDALHSRGMSTYYMGTSRFTNIGGDLCPKCAKSLDKWWKKKRRDAE